MYYSQGFRVGLLIGAGVVLVIAYAGGSAMSVMKSIGDLLDGLATFVAKLEIPPHLVLLSFAAYGVGWYSGVNWTERRRATYDAEDAMARRSRHRGIERDVPQRPPPEHLPREAL